MPIEPTRSPPEINIPLTEPLQDESPSGYLWLAHKKSRREPGRNQEVFIFYGMQSCNIGIPE
jgi:hypothetical protein